MFCIDCPNYADITYIYIYVVFFDYNYIILNICVFELSE